MALNIKNEEAHELARQLAEATGTSLTEAVTAALRRSLHRESQPVGPDLVWKEVREIQEFVARLPERDRRTPEEILGYDEHGLPT